VRAAAGGVFNVLFKSGGGSAMDSVIPALLSGLESDKHSAQALEGLRVVLGVRPQLLSVMVPRLIKPPASATNLRALGALADVAGAAIHAHLAALMPPLLALASSHPDVSPAAAAAHQAVAAVALSVQVCLCVCVCVCVSGIGVSGLLLGRAVGICLHRL
jgi:hypothetical protein